MKSDTTNSKNDDDITIVPSGLALNIAASWLGIKDVDTELEDKDEQNTVASKSSKQYGGLGYVGSKRKAVLAGVEHKLGKKVYGSFKNRMDDDSSLIGTSSRRGFQKAGEKHQNTHTKNNNNRSMNTTNDNQSDDDDDEDEGGRGAAFTAKGKNSNKGSNSKVAGLRRQDLLLSMPGNKKKRRNR